jgi:hypothetical protein
MGSLITEKEFLDVYNANLPNKWIKFAFRYFSTSTLKKDKWLNKIIWGILIGSFLIGFIGTILNSSLILIGISVIILALTLLVIGILEFGAFLMNNLRIRKIMKELHITKHEYDIFSNMYL